jgi:mono/diheme cytochrome c family protein
VVALSMSRIAVGLALALVAATAPPAAQARSDCPQPRFTGKAPDEYWNRPNPLQPTEDNVRAGESIFQGHRGRISCASCHGAKGDGKGPLSDQFDPPPRNFTCEQTIRGIPDGHLFWIVRFGSPGTSMPPHKKLSDEQIWQVVLYLHELEK